MPTRPRSQSALARELAQRARSIDNGSPPAAIGAFGRFLVPDAAELAKLVARLPTDVRRTWREALACVEPGEEWRGEARSVPVAGRVLEMYLRELDGRVRRHRGVYFTPRPLIGFICRSVSRLVQQHFANGPIHLIDPACGYGAFLMEAAGCTFARRLTGIELCPVTWAVAHLLLALEPGSQSPLLIQANPLTAGDSLRSLILGPAQQPHVPVIVGNPPWSNFGRLNRSPWISELLADYRAGLAERKTNLADDAIKFIRWGQYWIDEAGAGILALVTPNTWLGGLTHRRMRQSLLASFDEVCALDLHGEAGRSDGDENVFDVRSGVAIVVMVKAPGSRRGACRLDLHGSRRQKFAVLQRLRSIGPAWTALAPQLPDWSLAISGCGEPSSHLGEYSSFWPLNRIFKNYVSGVQTKNDAVFVGFTKGELAQQVRRWLDDASNPAPFEPQRMLPYLVAPFDRRWIYYERRLLGRARYSVMRHMLRPNLALVFMRQSSNPGVYDHFLAVDCLVSDRVFYSRHGAPYLAPLWIDDSSEGPNLASEFISAVEQAIQSPPAPLSLFHYIYAVTHAPGYRLRFGHELRRGFPRIPLPSSRESFFALTKLGRQLVDLHVLGVEPPAATEEAGFRIGGYEVASRWQRPRRGRVPAEDDHAHVQRLRAIGAATRRIAAEIDSVCPDHWWS
jgi:predicted helicase